MRHIMVMLAIETTGQLASAALYKDGEITLRINKQGYSHLQELVPMAKALMEEGNISGTGLDAVAVSRGPGSFTGVRIGVVTAKALAQVWNVPIVPVPTLATFAFGDYDWVAGGEKLLFCPIFDARRNQVYSGAYEPLNRNAVIEDGAYDLSELLISLEKVASSYDRIVFFGDGIAAYRAVLDGWSVPHELAPEKDRLQRADSCARLGAVLFNEGILSDCYTAEPEYLRQAEAERKLREKSAK